MKRSHFYILAAAIGLLTLLALVAIITNQTAVAPAATTGNNDPTQLTPTEPTESIEPLSTTTANGETFIIDPAIPIEERCTPVTLACLEAQPEWGPTEEVEGMRRVDPRELTLFDDNFPYELANYRFTSNFATVSVMDDEKSDYCNQWGINPDLNVCSKYGPEVYQELAITSVDTGEVIHAFKLNENYSLLNQLGSPMGGGIINIGGGSRIRNGIRIGPVYWESWRQQPYSISTKYVYDMYTGEVLEVNEAQN
jgi:hypothetical protein